MAFKVLQLSNWQVKEALKHEALQGKKLIARGSFSMVYDGSKPNTVYKVTVDSYGYWMLNCWAAGVSHKHFPKVSKSFGAIGEMRIGGKDYPIYLFEMERLQKLETGTQANHIAKILCNVSTTSTMKHVFGVGDLDRAMFSIGDMIKTKLPRGIKNALVQLEEFCCSYPGSGLDMHRANFMTRKNGDLVITDPLMHPEIYKARVGQLQARGY